MVKSRMTALDVRSSVSEMETALDGLRLLNIYDLSPTMFLFKFGHGERKRMVLVENSIRMHLTELSREKPQVPSQFTLKLRKHVRAWRLSQITQLHHDRTVDMCFGTVGSEGCFHIIIELFAKGNIILTDHAYTILMLLRTHKDKDVQLRVHGVYPIELNVATTTTAVGIAMEGKEEGSAAAGTEVQNCVSALREEWNAAFARAADGAPIKSILSMVRHLGVSLAEHIMVLADVKNTKKKDVLRGREGCDGAEAAARDVFEKLLAPMLETVKLVEGPVVPGGYLITEQKILKGGEDGDSKGPLSADDASQMTLTCGAVTDTAGKADLPMQRYDDFSPILLAQYRTPEGRLRIDYRPNFGQVCDAFFFYSETQRIQQHNEKNNVTVLSKRERFERDHQRRITNLEREEVLNYAKGELIILNAARIDEAIGLINGALASGIQWGALKALLKRRHAEGHPVAYMIHDLVLERNCMNVLLEQELYDDEDDSDVQPVVVEIDLAKSAYANATTYFDKKKASKLKLMRTIAATEKAAAGALRKSERVAAKQHTMKSIVVERQRAWWEKLNWFLTSAGDVVLQGKDTQTTEKLMRRLLQLGDIFVHCDVEGALPCVLRPMRETWLGHGGAPASGIASAEKYHQPVSTISLAEAGGWCLSRSAAWEQKQTRGAWWVYASQITGGTASGCYLYEGERRHIAPQPLALGLGLLFCVERDVRSAAPDAERVKYDPPTRLPGALHFLHSFLAAGDFDGANEGVDYVPADTATSLHALADPDAGKRSSKPVQASRSALPARGSSTNAARSTRNASQLDAVGPALPSSSTWTSPQETVVTGPGRSKQQGSNHADDSDPKDMKLGCEEFLVRRESIERKTPVPCAAAGHRDPGCLGHLTKHQRKKLQRIKLKYAEQDEEERQIGAMLNGNSLAKVQTQQILAGAAERVTQHAAAMSMTKESTAEMEAAQGALRYGAVDESTGADEGEVVYDIAEDDPRAGALRHKQGQTPMSEEDPRETTPPVESANNQEHANRLSSRRSFAEDVHSPIGKSALTKTIPDTALAITRDGELRSAIVHYTSQPAPTDVVLHAVAVCAPFQTLIFYHYRVSLCYAAHNKKGHAAESILRVFKEKCGGSSKANRTPEKAKQSKMELQGESDISNGESKDGRSKACGAPSASLLNVLEKLEPNDLLEQLRGNCKLLKAYVN